jgi:hypothetical protein
MVWNLVHATQEFYITDYFYIQVFLTVIRQVTSLIIESRAYWHPFHKA